MLDHPLPERRIVIDIKVSIVTTGWYREETLLGGDMYQIYANLRSQVAAILFCRLRQWLW